MSQLHCYIAGDLEEKLKKKAEQAQLSISKYLALLVKKEVEQQWPKDYLQCFGGWQGEALKRPEQSYLRLVDWET